MGARVVAAESEPYRLAVARDFGAADPVDAIRKLTPGRGVDLAIDCAGAGCRRGNRPRLGPAERLCLPAHHAADQQAHAEGCEADHGLDPDVLDQQLPRPGGAERS